MLRLMRVFRDNFSPYVEHRETLDSESVAAVHLVPTAIRDTQRGATPETYKSAAIVQ